MNVTVSDKRTGQGSSAVIVLDSAKHGHSDIRLAEEVVTLLTGRKAFTWTDGCGIVTIGDSQVAAR